jgi:uncharacterized protein (DUF433 family)
VLTNSKPYTGNPTIDTWSQLVADLTRSEAASVPRAVSLVAPLLEGDPARLQLLLDLIVTFDLFETAPALIELGVRLQSGGCILAASALAPSPGLPISIVEQTRSASRLVGLDDQEQRAMEIRLNPKVEPANALERLLHSQRWPGSPFSAADEVAPLVALDELGGSASFRWLLSAGIRSAGGAIRRVPEIWVKNPDREWLGPRVAIVTRRNESLPRLVAAFNGIRTDQVIVLPSDEPPIDPILRNIAQLFGAQRQFILPTERVVRHKNPLDPEVFKSGAFDAHEMVVLAGATRRLLFDRLKEDLPSRHIGNTHYWTFNQLVALRTWQYFRTAGNNPQLSTRIVKRLEEFAGSTSERSVGVTADGRVIRLEDEQYVDVATNQMVLGQVVGLDTVFQPFPLGLGKVPSLLTPSEHTAVHPATLGGTPSVMGHRIPARAVAELHNDQGLAAVQRAYPELGLPVVMDANELGQRIIIS